jgi:peroxiredoxin Q/BCP
VISAYDAWGEKSMYGQTFEGLIRSSVIVGPDGKIAEIHRNVRTEGNGRRMAEAIAKLG